MRRRIVLRPPIAQGALAIAPDGRVRLELRRPWRDGTRALLFDPLDLLGRLAALTPKPRWRGHGTYPPTRRATQAMLRNVVAQRSIETVEPRPRSTSTYRCG